MTVANVAQNISGPSDLTTHVRKNPPQADAIRRAVLFRPTCPDVR